MASVAIDFKQFLIGIAQGALVGLGEAPDPDNNEKNLDLTLVEHTLGLLRMLKEKTQGNLSDEEQNLIDVLLRDLSEKFQAAKSA